MLHRDRFEGALMRVFVHKEKMAVLAVDVAALLAPDNGRQDFLQNIHGVWADRLCIDRDFLILAGDARSRLVSHGHPLPHDPGFDDQPPVLTAFLGEGLNTLLKILPVPKNRQKALLYWFNEEMPKNYEVAVFMEAAAGQPVKLGDTLVTVVVTENLNGDRLYAFQELPKG